MNETITKGLNPYRLAEKLRGLRLQKSMGLVQLAKHTGLSPAMLSKLECGKSVPTLPTLLRIAMVFGVGLDYFFADERRRPVVSMVRKKERIRLPAAEAGASYYFESLDFKANERKLNAYLAEFQNVAPGKTKGHHHPGVEFLYMLSGTLQLTIGGDEHVLRQGDAIYFDANVKHAYQRQGRLACTAIVVTTKS